jgi:hypothetical protein
VFLGSYHQYQCQLGLHQFPANHSQDDLTIFHELSVILAKPLHFWLENKNRFLTQRSDTSWPTRDVTDKDKFTNLFAMVTNEKDVAHDSLVRHSLVTVFLLRTLRNTTYYKDSGKQLPIRGPLEEEELVVGQLLYKLRMVKDMNAHPIWGVTDESGQIENIGGGYQGEFHFLVMFNL